MLKRVAACCSGLQRGAVKRALGDALRSSTKSVKVCAAACCNLLQRVAVLQRVAACCSVLQEVVLGNVFFSVPKSAEVCVCCSMLQRVAVWYSVKQRCSRKVAGWRPIVCTKICRRACCNVLHGVAECCGKVALGNALLSAQESAEATHIQHGH